MSKKILFLTVLLSLIIVNNVALSEIIPLKKPSQTKAETQEKLLVDVLKPLPKPIEKKEIKVEQKKVVVQKEKGKGFILPKKKTSNCWFKEN